MSSNLHTVFTSECNNRQFDWFATGVYESFRTSGMKGSITRLLACSQVELAKYRGLDLGPTFVHPNYRHNPLNGDESASYNKPASVMHFVREANFTEEYVLFIDADMLLRRPIDPVALGARKGVVVSEEVGYMIGTSNGLARNFLPADAVHLARPVGWYHIFHRDDLARIAPLWLEYCGRVRTEPEKYWAINGSIPANIPTGDAYVKFGHAPWISEMYGYSFGAALAGVQHVVTHGVVKYPSEMGSGFRSAGMQVKEPYIIHYGIDFSIDSTYNWNKMSYQKLDLYACNGRYFGPPPAVPAGSHKEGMRFVVNTLNRAFCRFYHERCPADSAAARAPCPPTERRETSGKRCDEHDESCCEDNHPNCWSWALDDQCEENKGFMRASCKRSCAFCVVEAVEAARQARREADPQLKQMARLHGTLTRMSSDLQALDEIGAQLDPKPAGARPSSARLAGTRPAGPTARRLPLPAAAHAPTHSPKLRPYDTGHAPASVHGAGVATPAVDATRHAARSMHATGVAAPATNPALTLPLSRDRAGGASMREELRAVAEAHQNRYAPGHVPAWLQRQAKERGGETMAASLRAPAVPLGLSDLTHDIEGRSLLHGDQRRAAALLAPLGSEGKGSIARLRGAAAEAKRAVKDNVIGAPPAPARDLPLRRPPPNPPCP